MKRWVIAVMALALALAAAASAVGLSVAQTPTPQGTVSPGGAPSNMAGLRVVHAVPDGPAIDVSANNVALFCNLPFKTVTRYASVAPGSTTIMVTPTGANQPTVMNTTVTLNANVGHTVVATGMMSSIQPLVLTDDNSAPPAGQVKVRFAQVAPNAPNVDVAIRGGPVLFTNVAFMNATNYLNIGQGTFDLEVRVTGTSNVILTMPGIMLNQGTVYTVFAMGLVNGQPPLQAVTSIDSVDSTPAPTGF